MVAIIRRGLFAAFCTLALSACQVIPGGERAPAPAPPPPPPRPSAAPADDRLPTDTERHRVALLVPLSGSNEAVGRAIANASTMALLDTSAENLRITTYDTATGAGTAAARAIADGNRLILGPLMREDVAPVLAQARPADVPLITFSNDSTVAQPDVFVMGHIPEQSVERTIGHALAQGSRRFGALLPQGEYGNRAAEALSAALSNRGELVAIQRYDRGNTSIISAAERLAAAGTLDAVMIAEGPRLSAMAASALARRGVRPNFLGTELWSGEAGIANAAALRGGWFSAVPDERYRQFVQSYQARFGEQPYRIATLGYDSVLLALRVARDWRPGRDFPVGEMVNAEGFLGLDGPFRFTRRGVGERAMEVRQVGSGTVTVIDPAPQRF